MNFGGKSLDNPEINITPLVDIVFLLLIFFMVSSSFREQPALDIDLPSANKPTQGERKNALTLSIREDGKVVLEDQVLTVDELKPALSKKLAETIIIRADKTSSHGSVVAVMDAAKESGAKKLAIATETPSS